MAFVFIAIGFGLCLLLQATIMLEKWIPTVIQKAKKKRQVKDMLKTAGGMRYKYSSLVNKLLIDYEGSRIIKETKTSIIIHVNGNNESETFYIEQLIDRQLLIKYVMKTEGREIALTRTLYDAIDQDRMIEIIKKDITANKREEKMNNRGDLPF